MVDRTGTVDGTRPTTRIVEGETSAPAGQDISQPAAEPRGREPGAADQRAARALRGVETGSTATGLTRPAGEQARSVSQPNDPRLQARQRAVRDERIDGLAAKLANRGTDKEELFDALSLLMRDGDNAEVLARYEQLHGHSLVSRIERRFSGRDLAHALAYIRNESGRLESHDLVFFAANGWDDRWIGGLATGEATFERALMKVDPDDPNRNREALNRRLWTWYPTDTGTFEGLTNSGRIRPNAPLFETLDVPAGRDPVADYITREFSGVKERWLLASLHLPREEGRIPAAYERAFSITQLSGEQILAEIEKLSESQYRELEDAFAFMRSRGLLPDGDADTLEGHLYVNLEADERAAFEMLSDRRPFERDGEFTNAAYVARRLEAQFGWNDDEDEMVRILSELVGDGTTGPTFAQVAAAGDSNLGKRLLSELGGDQQVLARLIIVDGKGPNDPEVVARRLMAMGEHDDMIELLDGKSADELEAIRTAGRAAFGDSLRNHVADVSGWLDGKHRVPGRALALYDLGDMGATSEYPADLYSTREGEGLILSPAARILYAVNEPGFLGIFGATDEEAITRATQGLSEAEKKAVPGQYENLARETNDTRGLYDRLDSEIANDEVDAVRRALRPIDVGINVDSGTAIVDQIVGDIEMELYRGIPGLRGAFDMESGALHEAMRDFKLDAGRVLDELRTRRELEGRDSEPLTAEEMAALNAALTTLAAELEPVLAAYLEEREAVTGAIKQTLVIGGALLGAAAITIATGGAGAPAFAAVAAHIGTSVGTATTLVYMGGMAAGSIAGATLGDATDGMDWSSSEFVVDDIILAGAEGASFYLVGGAKLAVSRPILTRVPFLSRTAAVAGLGDDAVRLGRWGTFAQRMMVDATAWGVHGGVTGALHATGDIDEDSQFFETTGDILMSSLQGAGIGAGTGVVVCTATGVLSVARDGVVRAGKAVGADKPILAARDRLSRGWKTVSEWRAARRGPATAAEQQALKKEIQQVVEQGSRQMAATTDAQTQAALEKVALEHLSVVSGAKALAPAELAAQAQIAANLLVGPTPSAAVREQLAVIFRRLAAARGVAGPGNGQQLEAWLAAQGTTGGSLNQRIMRALYLESSMASSAQGKVITASTAARPRPPQATVRPSTPAKPKVKTTPKPKVETTPKPKVETTAKPKVETTAKPKVETTAKPKVETTAKPKVETTAKPKVETTAKPKVETTAKPKVETTAKPKVETTAKPKVETTAKPKVETTPKPKVETTTKPKVETTGKPKVETAPKSKGHIERPLKEVHETAAERQVREARQAFVRGAEQGQRVGELSTKSHLQKFEGHYRARLRSLAESNRSVSELADDAARSVEALWEAGIETPSAHTQSALTKILRRLYGAEGPRTARELGQWLESKGFAGSRVEQIRAAIVGRPSTPVVRTATAARGKGIARSTRGKAKPKSEVKVDGDEVKAKPKPKPKSEPKVDGDEVKTKPKSGAKVDGDEVKAKPKSGAKVDGDEVKAKPQTGPSRPRRPLDPSKITNTGELESALGPRIERARTLLGNVRPADLGHRYGELKLLQSELEACLKAGPRSLRRAAGSLAAVKETQALLGQMQTRLFRIEARMITRMGILQRSVEQGMREGGDVASTRVARMVGELNAMAELAEAGKLGRPLRLAIRRSDRLLRRVVDKWEKQVVKAIKKGEAARIDDLVQLEVTAAENPLLSQATRDRIAGVWGRLGLGSAPGTATPAYEHPARSVLKIRDDASSYLSRLQREGPKFAQGLSDRVAAIEAMAKSKPVEALQKYTELLEEAARLYSRPGSRIWMTMRHPFSGGQAQFSYHWTVWRRFLGGQTRNLERQLAKQIAQLPPQDVLRLADALRHNPAGVGDLLLKQVKAALKTPAVRAYARANAIPGKLHRWRMRTKIVAVGGTYVGAKVVVPLVIVAATGGVILLMPRERLAQFGRFGLPVNDWMMGHDLHQANEVLESHGYSGGLQADQLQYLRQAGLADENGLDLSMLMQQGQGGAPLDPQMQGLMVGLGLMPPPAGPGQDLEEELVRRLEGGEPDGAPTGGNVPTGTPTPRTEAQQLEDELMRRLGADGAGGGNGGPPARSTPPATSPATPPNRGRELTDEEREQLLLERLGMGPSAPAGGSTSDVRSDAARVLSEELQSMPSVQSGNVPEGLESELLDLINEVNDEGELPERD